MKLSHLSETLIGFEIVKPGGGKREKIHRDERIYNFTVGNFDPFIFIILVNSKWHLKFTR